MTKKLTNMDLHKTKQIIYISKGFDKSYPRMYYLLNLSHCVKRYGHLCHLCKQNSLDKTTQHIKIEN